MCALTTWVALLVAPPAVAHTERLSKSGAPVRWDADVVHLVADASMDELGPGALDAAAAAFATWAAVEGARAPEVVVERADGAPGAGCTLRYAPAGDPLAGDALAVTILAYGDDGRIVDADIVLNGGADRHLAVLTPGQVLTDRYDLQNVLTHEAGHFFGLGEELEHRDDTMFVTSARGETKKRDLTADDAAGLTLLYGGDGAFTAACAVRAPGGASSSLASAIGLAVAIGAATGRRRPGRSRPS